MQEARVLNEPGVERLRDAYERVHPRLWRAVLAWSGSHEVADDACAEAFAQAARRGAALHDVDRWVWRAAFRIAAGDLAASRRRASPVGGAADVLGNTAAPPGLPEAGIDLLHALQQLSEQQRASVVLRDVADLTAAEAAAALGTTPATVRVQAMRGRRRLRQLLEEGDG